MANSYAIAERMTVPTMLALLHEIHGEASSDAAMATFAETVARAIAELTELRRAAIEVMIEAEHDQLAGLVRPPGQKLC
jgi:hypothetical protein